MAERPTIGITMGDAAGIGPEVVLKALADQDVSSRSRLVVIGDLGHLRKVNSSLGLAVDLVAWNQEKGGVEVLDLNNVPPEIQIGVDDAVTGRASAENIVAAVDLWRHGGLDAIATAPISKAALHLGGRDYPGHTEFLADLTHTGKFAMSFFADKLRVVLLSTHVSLLDAIALVKKDALVDLIMFADGQLSKLLGRGVRLAVAGLNPHASEGGMFGHEEAEEISPAIGTCQTAGIDVSGPYSPDTIFLRGSKGEFDGVIALYHDQATIPVKSLSFGAGVNVTLGLPFIRTSVDHGTAYDIAGRGVADASSMAAAIRLAVDLAKVRR